MQAEALETAEGEPESEGGEEEVGGGLGEQGEARGGAREEDIATGAGFVRAQQEVHSGDDPEGADVVVLDVEGFQEALGDAQDEGGGKPLAAGGQAEPPGQQGSGQGRAEHGEHLDDANAARGIGKSHPVQAGVFRPRRHEDLLRVAGRVDGDGLVLQPVADTRQVIEHHVHDPVGLAESGEGDEGGEQGEGEAEQEFDTAGPGPIGAGGEAEALAAEGDPGEQAGQGPGGADRGRGDGVEEAEDVGDEPEQDGRGGGGVEEGFALSPWAAPPGGPENQDEGPGQQCRHVDAASSAGLLSG